MKIDRGNHTAHPRTDAELQSAANVTARAVTDTFPGLVVIVALAIPGKGDARCASSTNAATDQDAETLFRELADQIARRRGGRA